MGACELKRQAKLEHWKMQIIDCRSSGMSVRGWCAELRTPLCKISSTGEIEQRFRLN